MSHVLRSFALATAAVAGLVLPLAAGSASASPTVVASTPPAFDTRSTPPAPTQHEASRPEIPDGSTARASTSAALAASATDCPSLKYCAWTGGYFTGPSISFTVGASYNWRNYGQSACATERTLAITDARCQITTHLDTATKRIQDHHIDALPYRDRRHLRYIASVRATVVANARNALAHHPR